MIALMLTALLASGSPAKHHAAPATAADPQVAQVTAALRAQGFSPAAIRMIETTPPELRDALAGYRTRAQRIGQALAAAKAAGDIARFGDAMRAGDALNAEIQRTRTEQMLHTLAALPPADRALFLRHIGPAAAPAPQGR